VRFAFDPVVTYDDIAERFVVAMIDEDEALEKGFLLYAVSNSSNPLDGFTEMHRIDVTENGVAETVLPDFPKIGWNADAHVITANMFGADSATFDHISVIVIDKSTALDGNPSTLSFSQTDRDVDFTLMPAVMHGSNSGDPMWFVVESGDALGSELRVVKMTDVLGSPIFTDTNLSGHLPISSQRRTTGKRRPLWWTDPNQRLEHHQRGMARGPTCRDLHRWSCLDLSISCPLV
jgi:hypothetical protein